jgi:uncharacterized protein (TIGR03435 family)
MGVHAQVNGSPDVVFEVASVKPNFQGNYFRFSILPGGRLIVVNVPLEVLIRRAHHLEEFQLTGAPSWVKSARFDVAAKAPDNSPGDARTILVMLQRLLADRFQLKMRTERKQMSVFALTHARPDRQLGPLIRPASTDCGQHVAGISTERLQGDDKSAPCTATVKTGSDPNAWTVSFRGRTLSQVALELQSILRRTVVDETGLNEKFDLDIEFNREQFFSLTTNPASYLAAPSIFTAVQEQLGLKLESRRGIVEVSVIERVEQPSPD